MKPQDRSKCPIVYIVAGQAGSTTTLLQYYSSSLKHFSSTSQEKAPLKTGKNIREKKGRKENKEKEGGGLNSAASSGESLLEPSLLASSLLTSRPPQTAGLWPLRGSTPMQCNVVRNLQMKVAGQRHKWRHQPVGTQAASLNSQPASASQSLGHQTCIERQRIASLKQSDGYQQAVIRNNTLLRSPPATQHSHNSIQQPASSRPEATRHLLGQQTPRPRQHIASHQAVRRQLASNENTRCQN